ncbi:MAG: hypothetical protein PHE57_01265, partial [Synergistales bacterium]|nr:hypothetical protein [Synergistales bacterium]
MVENPLYTWYYIARYFHLLLIRNTLRGFSDSPPQREKRLRGETMGVRDFCVPREDVLRGEINDAIFAADFGDLVSDGASEVYRDPATFFGNTHPARELK